MHVKSLQIIFLSLFLLLGCESEYDKGYKLGYSNGEYEGYNRGRESGYSSGYSIGKEEGYSKGKKEGIQEGKKIGFQFGYKVGKKEGKKEKFNEAYYLGYLDKSKNLAPKTNLKVSTVFAPYLVSIATYFFATLGISLSLLSIVFLLKRNLTIKNKIPEIIFIIISIFAYFKFIETNFIGNISMVIRQLTTNNILIVSLITIIVSYTLVMSYMKAVFFTPISHVVIEVFGLIISTFILLSVITCLLNWQMIASSIGNITYYIYILISFSLGVLLFFGLNYKKIFRLH